MIRKIKDTFILSLVCLGFISCAQEKEESAMDIQRRILDAYVQERYPSATQLPNGLTYISKTTKEGTNLIEKGNAAYVNYTSETLNGVYTSTNDTLLLRKLGTYKKTSYYGPKLYEVGYGSTFLGIEELLIGMKNGEKVTAIVPPWLTGTTYSPDSYNNSTNMIYTFEVKSVIKDIVEFQKDTMKAYAAKHYPGLDTLSAGFYYKLTSKESPAKDSLVDGDNVSIRYIGKLLDGFVFDTNIRDSAKIHGIYDPKKEYSALSVVYKKDLASFVESASLAKGFCMAVQNMKYEERSFTMFNADLGYGAGGNGENIGPYQPLIFYIYLEPNENEREEEEEA